MADTMVYDSEIVLSFEDILNGKAGQREAEVARAWSNGEIKAPATAVHNFTVESEAGYDMRIGNKKRRRHDPDYANIVTHDPKPKETDQPADQPPPPRMYHEAITPALLSDLPDAPASKPPAPAKPPVPNPKAPATAAATATATPPPHPATTQLQPGSNARLKAWQPVPDCFTVLTKLDVSGKVRKTFLTPDNKRWYTLKDAKAHWESQGGDLTCTTHPVDKPLHLTPTVARQKPPPPPPPAATPPAATPPAAAAAVAAAPAAGTWEFKRGARLVVPDQFQVTSKVDAAGKTRKLYFTPDNKRFVTFKEAKVYWEGLGHTLTFNNSSPAPPPLSSTPPAPKDTAAPAPAPAAADIPKGSATPKAPPASQESKALPPKREVKEEPVDGSDAGGAGGAGADEGAAEGGAKVRTPGGASSSKPAPAGPGSGGKSLPAVGERWVPAGWKAEGKVRKTGNRLGQVDWTFVSPDGTVFRSYVAAQAAFPLSEKEPLPSASPPAAKGDAKDPAKTGGKRAKASVAEAAPVGPPLESLEQLPAEIKALARIDTFSTLTNLAEPVARVRTIGMPGGQ